MSPTATPALITIEQRFPPTPVIDFDAVVAADIARTRLLDGVAPGARIAVGLGSRGIHDLAPVARAVVRAIISAGLRPFVVPAMGSHGGGTPDGQADLLAHYGLTATSLGIPFETSIETEEIGEAEGGIPVLFSRAALQADGIVVINRVKPHTDFSGTMGSGLLKMLAIGLGKPEGAGICHSFASRLGHEAVIRRVSRVVLSRAPVLGGVAILENQRHRTALVEVIPAGEIETRETALFPLSASMMPRLPLSDIDLLIVDRIGKNISGAGMDPHVIGREIHGYSSSLVAAGNGRPVVRRIFVRTLTPESGGNAIGLGLADFVRSDLLQAVDFRATYLNALTALTPQSAKVPIHFATDREVIAMALASTALSKGRAPRVMRISDTLNLERLQVSTAFLGEVEGREDLIAVSPPEPMPFDDAGNLLPMPGTPPASGDQR